MVSLDATNTTLATLNAPGLFNLAMKLLDLPADGADGSCFVRGGTSIIVGDDKIRPVGRNRNAEQLDFVILGKVLDLDTFALLEFSLCPREFSYRPIGKSLFTIIHQSIGFDGAIVNLAIALDY